MFWRSREPERKKLSNVAKSERKDMFNSQKYLLQKKSEIDHSCDLIDTSIASFPPQPRVIAIGDIHGDFQALITCMRDCAQVADYDWDTDTWKWVGGETFVVLVGDLVDRFRGNHTPLDERGLGPGENEDDELAIILMINQLNPQAIRAGGRIFKCLGNHEIENMNGNYRSVTPKYVKSGQRQQEWKTNGIVRNALFSCGAYGVVQIGQWIFCHGGLSKGLILSLKQAQKSKGYENVVDFIHQQLTMKYNDTSKTQEQDILTKRIYNSQQGVHRDKNESFVWNDGFSNKLKLDDETCGELEENLSLLGEDEIKNELMQPKYLVVGHRQQPETDIERLGWSNIEDTSDFDQDRRLLFEYNPRKIVKAKSLSTLRINGDCTRQDSGLPSVWRVDVSMSRSFKPGENKKFPQPQVLEILFDSESRRYLPPRVLVSIVPRFFVPHYH